jgi:replicative DNA helicase
MEKNDLNSEFLILHYLLKSVDFAKKILPYLKSEYFAAAERQKISAVVKAFYEKYEKIPPVSSLIIYFKEKDTGVDEEGLKVVLQSLKDITEFTEENFSVEYLIDLTEEYFQKRALYNALVESLQIFDSKPNDVNSIPEKIQKSLQVCFNTSVGHDYFGDTEVAFENYIHNEARFPTHLEQLNRSTGGGFSRQTLNVPIGAPGSGKSRLLVDLCCHYMRQGLNCLYVTLELSELNVRQRFDANLLDTDINTFPKIEKEKFLSKVKFLKGKVYGKLLIKQYPAAAINTNHLKALLEELKSKKGFISDVIAVDYIGLMLPTRPADGLYQIGKNVSEELKGLFSVNNVIGFAPAQLNRGGWNTTDAEMGNIAESAGIIHNADFGMILITTENLMEENKIMFKIIKNRLYSLGRDRKFLVGYDDNKMRHFDVSNDNLALPDAVPGQQKKDPKHLFEKFIFDK